jgi:hypothetical protein
MNKPKVLFLCTGNSARSQMAEGLLRAMAGEQFDIFSAGTEPKGSILPEVQEVMREIWHRHFESVSQIRHRISWQSHLRARHHGMRRCRGKLSCRVFEHGHA